MSEGNNPSPSLLPSDEGQKIYVDLKSLLPYDKIKLNNIIKK
jgi:hypothetical protein